jgi:gamma-glutamylaminecyclotransferase
MEINFLFYSLQHVHGELFAIDDQMLSKLDILEEYPKLYTRREEPIVISEENSGSETERVIHAWTYFLFQFRPEMLELPQLDIYASEGPHCLPYVSRYVRDKAVDHRLEVKLMAS